MTNKVYQWIKKNANLLVLASSVVLLVALFQFDHVKYEIKWKDFEMTLQADD